MKRQYYSMEKTGQEANINIYGDIYSFSDTNLKSLTSTLDSLTDVSQINVYINSYGGEVAEGLAIYNALKRHKAKVTTYCDGFAASIASVIFMAGDERIMNESSLLMIHNAWSWGEGNAEQLRKQADDLEKITQASIVAYKSHSTLTEEEIKSLMDNETWILPDEALEYGFATSIEKTEKKAASQNAKLQLVDIIKKYRQEADKEDDEEDETPPEEEEETKDEEEETSDEETSDEEKPEDSETSDEEETSDETEEDDENKTTQYMSNFFNAIFKM